MHAPEVSSPQEAIPGMGAIDVMMMDGASSSGAGSSTANQSSNFAAFSDTTYNHNGLGGGLNSSSTSIKAFFSSLTAAAHHLSFSIIIRPQNFAFSLFLIAVEILQLVLVPISSLVALSTTSTTWTQVADILRYPYDPTPQSGSHYSAAITIAWCLAAFSLASQLLWFFEWLISRSGSLPHQSFLTLLKYFSGVSRVLVLPTVCLSIALLRCSNGAAGDHLNSPCYLSIAHAIVVSIIALATNLSSAGYAALFQTDFLPSLDRTSQSHSRISFLLFLAKLSLALLALLRPVSASLQGFIIMLVFFLLAASFWLFLPYYNNKFNIIYASFFSAALWSSLVLFVASIVSDSNGDSGITSTALIAGLLAAQLAGAVIVGGIVGVTVQLRLKWLEKKLRSGASSIRYPFDFDLLLRPCYNVKSFPNLLLNEKAADLASRFHEKFPMSAFVYLVDSVFAFECHHDPRGTVVQAKTGKRQDCYMDVKFLLNCMAQHSHDVIDEEAGGKREIETMLDSAQRHHRLAKTLCARFWVNLSKAGSSATEENSVVDSPQTWQLMRSIHDHDNKAYNILMGLLRKYPTHVAILRHYARFMDEVRNDKEASNRAFLLADQFEEEHNASKKKKHTPRGEKDDTRAVKMMAPATPDQDKPGPTVEDTSESTSGAANGAIDEDDETASLSSASGLGQQGDEAVKTRSYRRKFESAKSFAALRLRVMFLASLLILFALIVAEYIATTRALSNFDTHLQVMTSATSTQASAADVLFNTRLMDINNAAVDSVDFNSTCETILSKVIGFESEVATLFKQSKTNDQISSLWSACNTEVLYYMPGSNPSDFSQSKTYLETTKPIWDACLTLINAAHALCNGQDRWAKLGSSLPIKLNPNFRMVIENPWNVSLNLNGISTAFGAIVNNDLTDVRWISLGLFISRIAVAVVAVGLLIVMGFRSIAGEHRAAMRFFRDIPRSTISNITFKLSAGDEIEVHELSTTSSLSRSRLSSSSSLALIQVLGSLLLLVGLGAVMFALIFVFYGDYSTSGALLDLEGARRVDVLSALHYAQEYAVKDPYGESLSTTYAKFTGILAEVKRIDEEIKYGNNSAGIEDYLRTNEDMYELWYQRPCPAVLNLTGCYGLAQLLRRHFDALKLFAATPSDQALLNSTSLQEAIIDAPYVSAWITENIQLLYDGITGSSGSLYTGLTIILAISCVVTGAVFVLFYWTVDRIAHETEQLLKMLIFVPVSDLERISAIKEFIESDADISKATKQDQTKAQEQQTKNLLDGCEDAVLVVGPLLTIEIVNPAAEKLSEFVAQDLLGQPISIMIPEQIGKNIKLIQRLRKGAVNGINGDEKESKNKKAREITLQKMSGHRIQALVTISKSTVNGRTSQALFIRDITPLKEHEKKLLQQQKLAEQFLTNIIPKTLVKQLADRQASGGSMIIAQTFEEVTVMFADIVQFTNMSSGMAPEAVVRVLNELVSEWDKLALSLGVEKIKTIGDCYMACTGVPVAFADHADVMMDFCIGMQRVLTEWNSRSKDLKIKIRIGMNTGSVVAGVLGIHKMAYDLWGETVSTAERMESSGFPDRIQVSETTYKKVKGHGYKFENRGKVQVKGRGELEGYLYVGQADDDEDNDDQATTASTTPQVCAAAPPVALSPSQESFLTKSEDFHDFATNKNISSASLLKASSSLGSSPGTQLLNAKRAPSAGSSRSVLCTARSAGKQHVVGPTAVQDTKEMEEILMSNSIHGLLSSFVDDQQPPTPSQQ